MHEPRSATTYVGGFVGVAVGCVSLGGAGTYAFVLPDGSLLWSLSFIAAFIAAVFGFLAPLVLLLYLGSGSRSQSVYGLAGYLLSTLSIFVIGLVGTRILPVVGVGTPLAALVLFDAFIGGTLGGILGTKIARRTGRARWTG